MVNKPTDEINWEDLYIRLYAFTDSLIKSKSWFRGPKADSFIKGKQVHDYVSDAIEKYILEPEKFDSSKNQSLLNYLKYHVIRTLVGNDVRSGENKTTADLSLFILDHEDDDERISNLILPYSDALFDQQLDYDEIMQEVEKEVSKDKLLEDIFLGLCCYGLKRREIIVEFKITPNQYDNGARRLNTILKNISIKFDLKSNV